MTRKMMIHKDEFDGSLVFGVKSFNERTGRKDHLDFRADFKSFFLDPSTGLLKAEMKKNRSCAVCQSNESREIFVKDGFVHRRCIECRFVYVSPIVKEKYLEDYYKQEHSWAAVLESEVQQELDRKKFGYGLQLIEGLLPDKGRVIDVGCGPGVFLKVARERDWDVTGLELNLSEQERLKELGIPLISLPLEQADVPSEKFHCVTLWETLEHLPAPGDVLKECRRILKPGGLVFICVPNFDALVTRLMHEKSGTFAGYSHINFFNASVLERLLTDCGLEPVARESVITELGTINNYLNFEDPYFGGGAIALPSLTPEFIHSNFLGSRIIVIGQKAGE